MIDLFSAEPNVGLRTVPLPPATVSPRPRPILSKDRLLQTKGSKIPVNLSAGSAPFLTQFLASFSTHYNTSHHITAVFSFSTPASLRNKRPPQPHFTASCHCGCGKSITLRNTKQTFHPPLPSATHRSGHSILYSVHY